MDEIRDTQRTDSLTRFIEQYAVRTNPFGENRAAERAYRRAERISAGIYMLTNHISTEEPIRSQVRGVSSEILCDALKLKDEMRSPNSLSVAHVTEKIRYLISLVRIMTVSGFISQANASVVIEALDELGNFMQVSQRSILSENVVLTREDLVDVRATSFRVSGHRAVKDTSVTSVQKDAREPSDSSETSQKKPDSLSALSVRVQSILDVLKAGGSLSIKDISTNLPEYSEKMIQRELLELVTRGAVKKTGLKRWSRYSLPA